MGTQTLPSRFCQITLLTLITTAAGEASLGYSSFAGWRHSCLRQLAEHPRPQPERIRVKGASGDRSLPVPFGVKAENFRTAMSHTFSDHPLVTAIIFFGSRTHFNYGYLPDPDADLNTWVILSGPQSEDRLRSQLTTQLDAATGASPVAPNFFTESDLVLAFSNLPFFLIASPAEDAAIHRAADQRTARSWFGGRNAKEHWVQLMQDRCADDLVLRRMFGHVGLAAMVSPPPSPIVIGKQAIFVIRDSDDAPQILRALSASGYSHFAVMENAGGGDSTLSLPIP